MRIAEFETVIPSISEAVLPVRLEQKAPILRPALFLAFAVPFAALFLVPIATIALHVVADPATRANLMIHPGRALLMATGLLFVVVLCLWPLLSLVERIGRKRIVLLDRKDVSITDRGLFGSQSWHQPLSTYLGLAHHVRSTHSGIRHELILIHAEPYAHVLLAIGPHFTHDDLRTLANRLSIPIVPPTVLYPRMRLPYWIRRTGLTPNDPAPAKA